MLYTATEADIPTIKNIIVTRLESIPRVKLLNFKFKIVADCLKLALLIEADALRLGFDSFIELPLVFDKTQLLNEIDEIAEGIKTARLETIVCSDLKPAPLTRRLPGTGLRGRWAMGRSHV